MVFEAAAIAISFGALGLCAYTINKVLDETFRSHKRLINEAANNAERADFWAREASQINKDLMSVMEDNAERRHTNLELSYKLAKLEATDGK